MHFIRFVPFCCTLVMTVLLYFSPVLPALLQWIALDRLGHGVGFFFFSWLVFLIVDTSLVLLCFSLLFYAALTEIGQYYLGYRRGDIGDFYADAVGIVLFALWQLLLVRFQTATRSYRQTSCQLKGQ